MCGRNLQSILECWSVVISIDSASSPDFSFSSVHKEGDNIEKQRRKETNSDSKCKCHKNCGFLSAPIIPTFFSMVCFAFSFISFIKTDIYTHTRRTHSGKWDGASWSRPGACWCWFVCCLFFFGFFGISVPLHIVVRIIRSKFFFSTIQDPTWTQEEKYFRFLIIKIVVFHSHRPEQRKRGAEKLVRNGFVLGGHSRWWIWPCHVTTAARTFTVGAPRKHVFISIHIVFASPFNRNETFLCFRQWISGRRVCWSVWNVCRAAQQRKCNAVLFLHFRFSNLIWLWSLFTQFRPAGADTLRR